ncbi:uncharacterized protein PFL1_02256 [Pseudozyma flocculosa PF-1]|uniref:Late embryogenesis abundant protein LEA-2 subgroup domain-containing protein n=1 Tax=Pseudozyma flocculosa TaxID=84751 RepID=A0A5C3F5Z1_9BASI|nr:uncharacterized protein PFL1_02256 [Pseudozyma flocculosa PF-1]EPQ30139.1 hypothetical protein PFL1_02256 [Pseudozyma flocculosa PF-1]SPO39934.1 uncharacterized protein PSFLO_05415 [Pseudozyma flocculosa]
MSGRPNSFYDYSAAGGSAADAYNTPSAYGADQPYAGQHRPQHSTASQRDPAHLTSPTMAPATAPLQHEQGTGTGMYESRPTHSNGYAMANDDDDDDDEDEDWNVYDDFNMTRPLSSVPNRDSMSGLQANQEGYWDASTPGTAGGDSKADLQTPYSDYPQRKSLLNSEAFGFDVRNADPRRSLPPVHAGMGGGAADGSREANRVSMLSGAGPKHADSTTGIELITVPALGTEFSKEEMRDMTRKTKKKKKRQAKKRRLGMWAKGDDHLWGWLSPRVAVFIAFIFLAMLGVMLYFVIPRVPSFAFLTTNPVTAVPDGASMKVHHSPTNFSMTMDLNLRADNSDGWIPSVAKDMQVTVYDATQNKKVGEGKVKRMSFPGHKRTVFKFPVDFSYVSLNATGDTTFLNFYTACGPKQPNTPRPSLNLRVVLKFGIQGLIGSKGSSTTVGNLECPFALQNYE